jgi:hypothetical protein
MQPLSAMRQIADAIEGRFQSLECLAVPAEVVRTAVSVQCDFYPLDAGEPYGILRKPLEMWQELNAVIEPGRQGKHVLLRGA